MLVRVAYSLRLVYVGYSYMSTRVITFSIEIELAYIELVFSEYID